MDILMALTSTACYIVAAVSILSALKAKRDGDYEKYKTEILWAILYVVLAK